MSFRDDFLLLLGLLVRDGLNGCVCELVLAPWVRATNSFLKILVLNTYQQLGICRTSTGWIRRIGPR